MSSKQNQSWSDRAAIARSVGQGSNDWQKLIDSEWVIVGLIFYSIYKIDVQNTYVVNMQRIRTKAYMGFMLNDNEIYMSAKSKTLANEAHNLSNTPLLPQALFPLTNLLVFL